MSYHLEWRGLDENGLRERAVRRLRDEHPLPGQRLDDAPVVEVVVVGVGVQVGQGHAVQLGVGQGVHDVGLEVLNVLGE